jgi:hypothetical protein
MLAMEYVIGVKMFLFFFWDGIMSAVAAKGHIHVFAFLWDYN